MSEAREPIGTLLLQEKVASKEQLEAALTQQQRAPDRGTSLRLCSLLLAAGVDERALTEVLCHQLGTPGIVLGASMLDLSALSLIPRVVAERLKILPVDLSDEVITVACADPLDEKLLSQVAFSTGRQVQPLLALERVIGQTAAYAYDAHAQGSRQAAPRDREGSQEGRVVTDGLVSLEIVRPDVALGSSLPADEAFAAEALEDDSFAMEDPGWGMDMPSTVAINPSVLVVDDDEAIRGLLVRVLEMDGYEVDQAAHGKEALERLQASPPRLVVLDAMLPEVHGFTICQQIKASASYGHIPVIMISAVYKGWEHARDIHEIHGADRFIEKPFDVHYLRRVVAELLDAGISTPSLDAGMQAQVQNLQETAQAAYEAGDMAAALERAAQWTRIASFDPVPHLLRGNIFHHQQDFGAALVEFERAATFGPELFAAQKNLALVYERLGFLRRAFERWRVARSHAPDEAMKGRIDHRLKSRYADYLGG